MNYNIAIYIHHHGSGHFMRCLSIAKQLVIDHPVILIGSSLKHRTHLIPKNIQFLHLPIDTPKPSDVHYMETAAIDSLHYTPLNVAGLLERNAMMTTLFEASYPLLLIVDVSVEVTQLARLCGIPTIVMRQHGNRSDLPHRLAYQSAALLIAPFSEAMETSSDKWLIDKTFYSGGFSRYERTSDMHNSKLKDVGIIIGTGGTSIDYNAITHIAKQCPELTFQVLGKIQRPDVPDSTELSNLIFHGSLTDVAAILSGCYLVIGNTGHNTVMELAALNKSFIGIPEDRPFEEQIDKSGALIDVLGYTQVLPDEIFTTDWKLLIAEMQDKDTGLAQLITENAVERIAERITLLGDKIYG